jgi:hypothetical protein
MSTALTPRVPVERGARSSRSVAVWAAAVPVLVIGQFAMVAVVPVVLVVVGTLRNARLRALRWWAGGLAAAYALPLALWAIGPERAPSLSEDMHPLLAALIVAAAIAFLGALLLGRRRSARSSTAPARAA